MQNFRNEWGKLEITEKITKNCSHIGREKYTKREFLNYKIFLNHFKMMWDISNS